MGYNRESEGQWNDQFLHSESIFLGGAYACSHTFIIHNLEASVKSWKNQLIF